MKCGDEGREGGVWWCEGKKESEGKKKKQRGGRKKKQNPPPQNTAGKRREGEGRRRARCGDYTRWLASRKEGVQCVLCGGKTARLSAVLPLRLSVKSSRVFVPVKKMSLPIYRSGFRSRNRFNSRLFTQGAFLYCSDGSFIEKLKSKNRGRPILRFALFSPRWLIAWWAGRYMEF